MTEAKEISNGNQTWKQVFDYDRYGNRTTYDKWQETTAQTLTTVEEPAIDNTTNRINSSGYTFDANGNLIVDAEGRQFTFNGDNKQTKVLDDQYNPIGEYFFDGEGKRVKKVVGSNTTVFVYSGSKLIAEYSTETPPSNPTTSWTVTDQLGSPRVIVNALGQVVSRRDFLPFGEELGADGTYRTPGQKYGQTDSVRQKFTGYQKDEETGLDFAEARMYQSLNGRFTAIDPLLASGKSANPQTFNRYVYVMNSPLILNDPSGMQAGTPASEEIWIHTAINKAGEIIENIRGYVNAAVRERAQYLLEGSTTPLNNFDQVQGERLQNYVNAYRGDEQAVENLNNRVLGPFGPTSDSAMQDVEDRVRFAATVNEISISLISVTNSLPSLVRGASTVATNQGASISRFGFPGIETPYGVASQSNLPEALAASVVRHK